jgi:hypothetical protein
MGFCGLRAARWVIQPGRLQWALMVAAVAGLLLSALVFGSVWGHSCCPGWWRSCHAPGRR